jgi:hypothetical protein
MQQDKAGRSRESHFYDVAMQIIPADVAACRADSRGADRPLLASLYDSLCIILFMLLDFRTCVIVMLRHESIVAAYGKGRFAGVSSLMMLPANFVRGRSPKLKHMK